MVYNCRINRYGDSRDTQKATQQITKANRYGGGLGPPFYRCVFCQWSCATTEDNRHMSSLIAYCGLDCESCPIHLATLQQDSQTKRNMRIDIARLCRETYGIHLLPEAVTDCDGCQSATGRIFSGCANCDIRPCAMGRKVSSCAYCKEYPCNQLQKHFQSDPTSQARLEALRRTM